jgi:ABC-type antimicrobial peptide transport system permease subunit
MSASREITLIRYVLKNIGKRKLRSGLTITGIAICIAFFIVLAAISYGLRGYLDSELATKKEGVIYMGRMVPLSSEEVDEISTITSEHFSSLDTSYRLEPEMEVPFIRVYGQGGFASYVQVYLLIGVGPNGSNSHWNQYNFDKELRAGKHLDSISRTEPGIVLGYELWNNYYRDKSVGDIIDIEPINTTFLTVPWQVHDRYLAGDKNLTSEDIGPIRNVEIIGILAKSSDDRWQDFHGYMPMEFLLRTFKLYDELNNTYYYPQLSITIDDATDFDFNALEFKFREAILELEGWDNRFELRIEWQEDMERTVSNWFFIIIAIISIVSIIGISNTMLMSVSERRIELGTLRALGLSRGIVKKLIFTEAIIICLIAFVIALVIGIGIADYFDRSYEESLETGGETIFFAPTEVNYETILVSFAIAVFFGAISALYPAHRATKLHPVEALRYG